MLKKLLILCTIAITCSSCAEFALIASGSSLAISQNVYAKAYSGVDMITIMSTEKDIKNHVYEKIKAFDKKDLEF